MAGLSVLLLVSGAVILDGVRRERPQRAMVAMIAMGALTMLVQRAVIAEWHDAHRSDRLLAEQLATKVPRDADAVSLGCHTYELQVYLGRTIDELTSVEELRDRLASGRTAYAFLKEEEYEQNEALFGRVVLRAEHTSRPGRVLVVAASR